MIGWIRQITEQAGTTKASCFFFELLGNGVRPERKQVARKTFYFLNTQRKATTDIGKTFSKKRQVFLCNLRRFIAFVLECKVEIIELKFAC